MPIAEYDASLIISPELKRLGCAMILYDLHSVLHSVSPGRPYLVIGAARSASLNISVLNRGDDAYDTHLFISFPKELYFVKVQQVMRMLLLC